MISPDSPGFGNSTRQAAASASNWLVGLERDGAGSAATHAVQFYEDDAFLVAVVADFFAGAVAAGQSMVLIATPSHRDAILDRMRDAGLPVDRALGSGRLTVLDALETLAAVMDEGRPDAARFRRTIGPALADARLRSARTTVRAFGEMVDILWSEGNAAGALELERLWNELADTHGFSLLCAYSMRHFSRESDARGLQSICGHHAHVIPTESYTRASDAARMVEIALLQQRALALESEIEHRKELEQSLRAALEAAETANRAKSDFLAVMSHELRTPLNAIAGHVQLLELGLRGPISEPQREALGRVQRSQRRLLSLIDNLLDFASADAGRLAYELKVLPLAALVNDAVSALAPLLAAKQLTCVVDLGGCGDPPAVRADPEKVHRILVNLLTNAVNFTPEGGRIRIACESNSEAVSIHVRDTGIGIPVSKLESIFEPFVQLATRTYGHRDGVGLGLAMSRALARGMKGDLRARSGEGEGATLTLTLRRGPERDEE